MLFLCDPSLFLCGPSLFLCDPSLFLCGPSLRWLDRNEDDGQIIRELVPEGEGLRLHSESAGGAGTPVCFNMRVRVCVSDGGYMAEWLGNQTINQKVAGSISCCVE